MFDALLNNALLQIDVAEALINEHEVYANKQPATQERLVKQYAMASCVTRLYAIYEWFVETLIADYLDRLPELLAFAALPEGLKTEYRMGISYVLSKVEAGRYSHLKHENVIRWYHEALAGGPTYRFVVEALTRHDYNLRLPVLEGLTSRVDLPDLRGWLSSSADIRDLYAGETLVVELLEAEIKEFVQIRNDASHGFLQNLQGASVLHRYCAVVRGLVRALAAYGHWHLLRMRVDAGKARHIGTVTEVFRKAGALVATIDAGVEVKVGMQLHFAASGFCSMQTVSSLRDNDVDIQALHVPSAGYEVGIACANLPRKQSRVLVDAS